MSTNERLREIIEPIVAHLGLDLYDLEFNGGTLVVTIDVAAADGPSGPGAGVDISAITAVTRAVSHALDELDPIASAYSLEVSSPGLERTLRTPRHHRRAVGQKVTVKTRPGTEGNRRVRGILVRADDESVDVALEDPAGETRTIAYDDIEKTRTVFEWKAEPKPGQAAKDAVAKKVAAKKAAAKKPAKTAKSTANAKKKSTGTPAGEKPAATSAKTAPADKKVTAS